MHQGAFRRYPRQGLDERGLGGEVERGGPACELAVERLVLGAVQREPRRAREEDRVALTPVARDLAYVGDQADAADDRSGVDRAAVRFVVERDVSRDDGNAERLTG